MKTTIFYIADDASCSSVARKLSSLLSGATLLGLPAEGTIPLSERVGIVSRIENGYPPSLVTSFIRDVLSGVNLLPVTYLFCVHVTTGRKGSAPLLTELCLQEAGCVSSYQNVVREGEEGKVEAIAEDIRKERIRVSFKTPFAKLKLHHLMGISQRMSERKRGRDAEHI